MSGRTIAGARAPKPSQDNLERLPKWTVIGTNFACSKTVFCPDDLRCVLEQPTLEMYRVRKENSEILSEISGLALRKAQTCREVSFVSSTRLQRS